MDKPIPDIKELFAEALEKKTAEDQAAYLDQVCGQDIELRHKIEGLLQAYQQADDIPESPLLIDGMLPEIITLTESPGTQIGRYKLLQVIGEGGCGTVYMAEQEHPIRRKVALKIIKVGMDTKQVIARFEAERQALAMMDHPNIARVYDAGATDTGRPYFVMELIKGVPITEYCDAANLTTQERLELFIPVCQAIQHAHQKGIIHRDIKPTNVMVTLHDDKPVPKIIDFGIAKAMNQRLTEKTLFTRYAQIIGTPEYMSPEQAQFNALDVDTRTDIYSLGVLLYELLTSTTPFPARDLRSKGYAEMQRIIRETEPVRPSTRLITLGDTAQEIARRRHTNPVVLAKQIKGDLDRIVIKTLEKDRTRRYGTVQALADDIERHINHQPISAGSPGLIYRSRKFLRRHRTGVIIGSILSGFALIAAVVIGQYYQSQHNLQAMQKQFDVSQEALATQDARNKLSAAQALYAGGEYPRALQALEPLIDNPFVGAQARLIRARMALDWPNVNIAIVDELNALLKESDEIASQAHQILAKICLEQRVDDDKTGRELEQQAQDHMQKAERLASDSAEGCFNRALLADTPAERMALLDQALAINPGHVDSRRIRAIEYYTNKNYDEMEIDATAITVVARDCPDGYSLRAIALREKAGLSGRPELLKRAIAEHNRAVELAPAKVRLYEERRKTWFQMGEQEKALADALKCIQLDPNEIAYHFYAFCSLTALGRYEEALQHYEPFLTATDPLSGARIVFNQWAAAYAYDLKGRDWRWHPEGNEPEGAAFDIMRTTIEAHQNLAKRARCVVREGTVPSWSPRGDELAYGRGLLGHMSVEILNVKSGATRLLCYSGYDPVWSPDGRQIAYTRHRRILRQRDIPEDTKLYYPEQEDREIWIRNADGSGKPRRLVAGSWCSWSGDSQRLYYYSPAEENHLCSINVADNPPKPVRIIRCMNPHPSVSSDEKYAIDWDFLVGSTFAHLIDLSSKKIVAIWPGYFPHISPNSKYIISSFYDIPNEWYWYFPVKDNSNGGTWVCDMAKGKAVKILDNWLCLRSNCSPQGDQIALTLYIIQGENINKLVCAGLWASIWLIPVNDHLFDADSGLLVRDWPWDITNIRLLIKVAEAFRWTPGRAPDAEQLWQLLRDHVQELVSHDDPGAIQAVQQLAEAYLWHGRYEEAEKLYLQTGSKLSSLRDSNNSSSMQLTEELAWIYLDILNQPEKADTVCQALSKTRRESLGENHPDTIQTLLLQGKINERLGRYQQAQQTYLDVLNLKPDTGASSPPPQAYENILSFLPIRPLHYLLEEDSLMLQLLEERFDDPNQVDRWKICAHYLLARLYATRPAEKGRDLAKALEQATLACELSGRKESICLDNLAAIHARDGQYDQAVARQKEALENLPARDEALKALFTNRLSLYERGQAESFKGLVACWDFQRSEAGVVLDSSGNNLHGRLMGDATIYADPNRGNVLRLDGDGDWVDCGADEKFDITDELTISVWIKVARFDAPLQTIVAKSGQGWLLVRSGIFQPTDAIEFACGDLRSLVNEYTSNLSGRITVNDGKWHYIAGVYDGHGMRIYVDGRLDSFISVMVTSRININKAPVTIGMCRYGSRPYQWNGLIDDLRIYSRALTPDEVKALQQGKEPDNSNGTL